VSVVFLAACVGDDVATSEQEMALTSGEELRGLVSSVYGADINRYVPKLVQQFYELKDHGDYYGFYTGAGHPGTYCGLRCQEHWQGIARLTYPPAARAQFLVGSSHDDGSRLAVVPTGSSDGLRLRGNQHSLTKRDWNTKPRSQQTMVHAEIIEPCLGSCMNHPGGMQTLGQYLFIGAEKIDDAGAGAKVFVYDTGGMGYNTHDPVQLWGIRLGTDGAAFAAVAKLAPLSGETESRVLLITAGNGSKTLTFNLSRLGHSITSSDFFGNPSTGSTYPEGTLTPSGAYPSYWTGLYQSMSLLVDDAGQLYLLGANKTESGGDDYLDLFELDVAVAATGSMSPDGAPNVTASVRRVAHKTMSCIPSIAETSSEGGQACDFSAASGTYVDPAGRLYFYATVHSDSAINGASTEWTRMMEFRPWNHVDNPSTSINETCSLFDAWVNLYDGPLVMNGYGTYIPFGLNSYMIDYLDHYQRDQGSFGTAYNFNDRVRSLQYCIPSGYKFRLFQHEDFGGASYDLPGWGGVDRRWWNSASGWSSGCFMTSTGNTCL
jgi:hypothetical protein